MWTSSVLCSFCIIATFGSEYELFDQNGWIPVSSDIVNKQIRRGITQAPQYTKADDVQIANAVSIVSNQDYKYDFSTEAEDKEFQKYHKGDIANSLNDSEKKESGLQVEYDFVPNEFLLPPVREKQQSHDTMRRSKKVADIDTDVLQNNLLLPKYKLSEFKKVLVKDDNQDIEDIPNEKKSHTYEVTENIIIEEVDQDSALKKAGYEYKPPDKKNFIFDLIKYLHKYNINNNDNLHNYALSRRPKAENPLLKPLQFRAPIKYNSPNHLAVDPLLAVLLSNYGYYLQGQYGIQNNYNNLYGYLASNNIHNNRPFGGYKLFSDTDSSQ